MASDGDDKNLPLCANVDAISVDHYRIVLECNFESKTLSGNVILSLTAQGDLKTCVCTSNCPDRSNQQPFIFILDCQDIIVHKVIEFEDYPIFSDPEAQRNSRESTNFLNFSSDNWRLNIWKPNVYCPHAFPRAVQIFYCTSKIGKSLLWVKDQNERPCVYTYGAWINNRSLLPCQEPPSAMATWEGVFKVPFAAVVLTSGDVVLPPVQKPNGFTEFGFKTLSVLPISTLALAIGYWHVIDLKKDLLQQQQNPWCRIIAPASLIEQATKEIGEYLPRVLRAAHSCLGPYPFPRLDVLVVPCGFGSMGMASPNLLFSSQSLLSGDGSLCGRIGHEVAHGWFGLLIGASDWTEEWLSEGFATFLEDILHGGAVQWSPRERLEHSELRAWIRWRTLEAEVEQTDVELQMLRPMKGSTLTSEVNGTTVTVVKNGMNPEKGFLQVHYVKSDDTGESFSEDKNKTINKPCSTSETFYRYMGYFLLRTLSQVVGESNFMNFLQHFVEQFRGKLIQSRDFLDAYFSFFPEIVTDENNTEKIIEQWLDNPGLPSEEKRFTPSLDNLLFQESVKEAQLWKAAIKTQLKRKRNAVSYVFKKLPVPEQVVILLEFILEEARVPCHLLKQLNEIYNLENSNAEIRHRWCELIVKHKYTPGYGDLKKFLTQDLAMGVYLFNELYMSGVPSQVHLVKECHAKVREQLEPNFQQSIDAMAAGLSKL